MYLGAILAKIRAKHGLTLCQFAELAGVSKEQMCRYLNNTARVPSDVMYSLTVNLKDSDVAFSWAREGMRQAKEAIDKMVS